MILYTEHKNINKKKWDDCIQRSTNGMVYAYSWYLDIVSPGWNALIEDYRSVFPLTWRKKYGFYYLYQPPFTQQLGVFSDEKDSSENRVQEFLDSIPGHYRFIEIQLNAGNTAMLNRFRSMQRVTYHLDLSQSYEKIQASFSENLERNIKRASKNNIEISSLIQPEEIIRLFRKNRGKEIDQLKNKEYALLLRLIGEATNRNLITLLGAKTSTGDWCAGAVFLKSLHEYIFFFSAADEIARNNGAMSKLINEFIRAHADEKKKFDFEGSMDRNLARFYKSFGSKEIVYLQVRKNNLPPVIKWMKG